MGKASRKKTSKVGKIGNEESAVPIALAPPFEAEPLSRAARNQAYALAALLAALTFAVYLFSLKNDFVWDDLQYVSENVHIRSLDAALFKWAFFDFYAANWHPLTWISHAVDYALWGMAPRGHRLTNCIVHAGNTFLVVLLAIRLLDRAREGATPAPSAPFLSERTMLVTAGTTGLLFGLHPVHVESAAWVAERKDLLCAFFFLLSILLYTGYAKRSAKAVPDGKRFAFALDRYYWGTALFFILALLSKPMAVTLPLVLLILDWYPLRRVHSARTLLAAGIEKLPLLALTLASALLTILAQQSGGAMESSEFAPLPARILVAAHSLIAYLRHMVPPFDLIPLYSYPYLESISLSSPRYLLATILVLGITAFSARMAKRQKVWAAAWGYYVVTLIPVLGLIQVGVQAMADRYAYLPSLGPFLLAGLGAAWLGEKLKERIRRPVPFKLLSGGLIAAVTVSLIASTMTQIGVWHDSMSLWSYVIDKDPEGSEIPYNNRGNTFRKMGKFDLALADYDKAIALQPAYDDAISNRGLVLEDMGRIEEALKAYNQAYAMNPRHHEAYLERGLIYDPSGRPNSAVPNSFNLGLLYSKSDKYDKAIESFTAALAIDKDFAAGYLYRGIAYSFQGDSEKAARDFTTLIELNPNEARVYYLRGSIYAKQGNKELARRDFEHSCALGNSDGCNALR